MRQIKAFISDRVNFYQLVKFTVAGGVCAIFEFMLYKALLLTFTTDYLVANMISTTFAIILNYVMLRKWVFGSSKYSNTVEFTAFMVVSAAGLILSQLFIWLYVEIFLFSTSIGKILSMGSAVFFNFIAKKFLVFKK